MLFTLVFVYLLSLCLCVKRSVVPNTDAALVDVLQTVAAAEEVPQTDAALVNALQTDAAQDVDWNQIICEIRNGMARGDEEVHNHIEASKQLGPVEKQEAHENFRIGFMKNFRDFFQGSERHDIYRGAFIIAAAANGIIGQLRNDIITSHKGSLSMEPSTIGTQAMASLMVTAYAFAIQGFVLAMLSPFDVTALPMRLRETPPVALLGGVFASLATFSFVISAPILGLSGSTLIYVFSQVVTGLCFDKTGVFGLLPQREITSAGLLGVASMAGGIFSTLDIGSLAHDAEKGLAIILPMLGVPALGGFLATSGVSFNSALAPYAGSPLRAGTIAYFMGALSMMSMALIMYLVLDKPSVTMEGAQWWQWVGSLVGVYVIFTSAALPQRLGVATFISVSGGAFSISSVAGDAIGIFGHKKPLTPLRILGVALSIIGMVIVQLFPGAVITPANSRKASPPESTTIGLSSPADIVEYVEDAEQGPAPRDVLDESAARAS